MKWQRNTIFKAVLEGGLDPAECTFEYDDETSRITHRRSKSSFLIEGSPSKYKVTPVVGDNPPWPAESFTWRNAQERILQWAREAQEDVDMPDLWAELQRDRLILTVGPYEDVENTPFTSAEQVEIAEQLRQVKAYVKTMASLSEAQLASLEWKLDMLRAAAGRMGRQDWRGLVGGVILSVIVQDLVPAQVVQHIFGLLLKALIHVERRDRDRVRDVRPRPFGAAELGETGRGPGPVASKLGVLDAPDLACHGARDERTYTRLRR